MAARKPHLPNFHALVTTLVQDAEKIAHEQVKEFADAERDTFARKIEAQRFESFKAFPLATTTLARKRRLRLSQRVMIATREYINSIKVFEEPISQKDGIGVNGKPSRSGTRFIVGIHPNKKARDAETKRLRWDVPLQLVARIHEYGAPRANIPARPHWGPHYEIMRERAAKVRQKIAQLVGERWIATIGGASRRPA